MPLIGSGMLGNATLLLFFLILIPLRRKLGLREVKSFSQEMASNQWAQLRFLSTYPDLSDPKAFSLNLLTLDCQFRD